VKVAGHVVVGSIEYWVPMCTGKWTYCRGSNKWWSLEPHSDFQGGRWLVMSCELFFPFLLVLVASLFVDSERTLFLVVMGPCGWLLGSSDLLFLVLLADPGLYRCQQSAILPPPLH
jgi:hypothetical protein